MEKQAHFKIDPYFALSQLCCIWHEQNVDGNAEYSLAFKSAMVALIYNGEKMLTHDEWDSIVRIYQERHGLSGEFLIDVQPELREELYQIIQEQKRFKDLELDYIIQGYGEHENLVYDKTTGKIFPCKHSEHYPTLIDILQEEYSNEFGVMPQQEKDAFIMNNFILVGKSYSQDWYIPDGIGFGSIENNSFSISYKS